MRNRRPYIKPRALMVGDRFAGVFDEYHNIFKKHVKESKHLFLKLDAWGIDARIFHEVLRPRNTTIVIHDDETGRVYQVQAATIGRFGRYFHFKEGTADYNAQVFLSRGYWLRTEGSPGIPIQDPRQLLAGELIGPMTLSSPGYWTEERARELFESL